MSNFIAGQRLTAAALNFAFNGTMQLISEQVLSGSASSVTFSSIPQTFNNLRLFISAQSNGAGTNGYDSANLRFNGVSAASYNWLSTFNTQAAPTPAGVGGVNATSMQCAEIWNAHFASAGRGIATVDIPNYSDVNNLKSFTGLSSASDGGTAGILQTYSGTLGGANTAAITSLTISMSTGSFIADSTFSLYGL